MHWRTARTTYQDSKIQSQKREDEKEAAQKEQEDVEKARRTRDYRKEKPQKALMEFKFGGLEV